MIVLNLDFLLKKITYWRLSYWWLFSLMGFLRKKKLRRQFLKVISFATLLSLKFFVLFFNSFLHLFKLCSATRTLCIRPLFSKYFLNNFLKPSMLGSSGSLFTTSEPQTKGKKSFFSKKNCTLDKKIRNWWDNFEKVRGFNSNKGIYTTSPYYSAINSKGGKKCRLSSDVNY